MTRLSDALTAAKTLLLTIDPSPQPPPVGVWIYPDEWEIVDVGSLPIILVYDELTPRERGTHGAGRARHRWTAVIDVLLVNGPLNNEAMLAEAKVKAAAWEEAMEELLFGNGKLLGTVDIIGDGQTVGTLYTYQPRPMRLKEQVFWGLRFKLPILQTHARIMKAQT